MASSDSYDSDYSDSGSDYSVFVPPDLNNIQPYQFEPTVRVSRREAAEASEETDLSSSEEEDLSDVNPERVGNTDWCDCGQCVPMSTGTESKCCQEVSHAKSLCDEASIGCLTDHEYFIDNCLRPAVVWLSLLEIVQKDGPLDEYEPISEVYRNCACRRLSTLLYDDSPWKCKKIPPSCALKKIQDAFPPESAAVFKYKRP